MTKLAQDSDGHHIQAIRPGTHQKVAYTGTAGVSAAVGLNTTIVRIVVTTAAYYKVGAAPEATTADVYLAADTIEYTSIRPGEKVSAIQVSSGGNLHVTEGA